MDGGFERWERQRCCVVLVVTSCLVGKTGRDDGRVRHMVGLDVYAGRSDVHSYL